MSHFYLIHYNSKSNNSKSFHSNRTKWWKENLFTCLSPVLPVPESFHSLSFKITSMAPSAIPNWSPFLLPSSPSSILLQPPPHHSAQLLATNRPITCDSQSHPPSTCLLLNDFASRRWQNWLIMALPFGFWVVFVLLNGPLGFVSCDQDGKFSNAFALPLTILLPVDHCPLFLQKFESIFGSKEVVKP